MMEQIKNFEQFMKMNEAIPDENLTIYKIKARDSEETIKRLIEHIGKLGNVGHSFSIVVDPDATKEEGKETFGWDGDGSDRIESVEILQKPVN